MKITSKQTGALRLEAGSHMVRFVKVGAVGRRVFQVLAALLRRHGLCLAEEALEKGALLWTRSTVSARQAGTCTEGLIAARWEHKHINAGSTSISTSRQTCGMTKVAHCTWAARATAPKLALSLLLPIACSTPMVPQALLIVCFI